MPLRRVGPGPGGQCGRAGERHPRWLTAPDHLAGCRAAGRGSAGDAAPRRCDHALLLDWRGRVTEATGANVFFIQGGVLHTPTPDVFLDGITRQTVIGLARARGVDVVERVILPEELGSFGACFLTGSAAEVAPVQQIGSFRYIPATITRQLADDYASLVRQPSDALAQPAA